MTSLVKYLPSFLRTGDCIVRRPIAGRHYRNLMAKRSRATIVRAIYKLAVDMIYIYYWSKQKIEIFRGGVC